MTGELLRNSLYRVVVEEIAINGEKVVKKTLPTHTHSKRWSNSVMENYCG